MATNKENPERDEAKPVHAEEAPVIFGTLLASRPQRSFWDSAKASLGSIIVHGIVIGGLAWATMSVGEEIMGDEVVTVIELPPEEAPPPPPPPPPSPDVAPQMEIAKGFQTLSVPDFVPPEIPPPSVGMTIREEDFTGMGREGGRADGSTKPEAKTVDELAVAPTFTPMTVRPELKNPDEVSRALQRNYPPLLRDAGIGGTPILWFFIDEQGNVVRTTVKESSGYSALDEAAQKVGPVMKFRPAFNRDKAVPVWVEIPIRFSVN